MRWPHIGVFYHRIYSLFLNPFPFAFLFLSFSFAFSFSFCFPFSKLATLPGLFPIHLVCASFELALRRHTYTTFRSLSPGLK